MGLKAPFNLEEYFYNNKTSLDENEEKKNKMIQIMKYLPALCSLS